MDTEVGVESEFYSDEFEIDYDNNLEIKIAGNKSLLPGLCSAEHNIPEDTVSMIEFNMIHSSPLIKPVSATID